jgi:hypothetical protein
VIRRYREAVNTGDISAMSGLIDEIAADDFIQEVAAVGRTDQPRELEESSTSSTRRQTGTSPKFQVQKHPRGGRPRRHRGRRSTMAMGSPCGMSASREFRDGKVARVTEYFADPFEAPAWRAPFVDQMAAAGDVV